MPKTHLLRPEMAPLPWRLDGDSFLWTRCGIPLIPRGHVREDERILYAEQPNLPFGPPLGEYERETLVGIPVPEGTYLQVCWYRRRLKTTTENPTCKSCQKSKKE